MAKKRSSGKAAVRARVISKLKPSPAQIAARKAGAARFKALAKQRKPKSFGKRTKTVATASKTVRRRKRRTKPVVAYTGPLSLEELQATEPTAAPSKYQAGLVEDFAAPMAVMASYGKGMSAAAPARPASGSMKKVFVDLGVNPSRLDGAGNFLPGRGRTASTRPGTMTQLAALW